MLALHNTDIHSKSLYNKLGHASYQNCFDSDQPNQTMQPNSANISYNSTKLATSLIVYGPLYSIVATNFGTYEYNEHTPMKTLPK